MSAPSEHIQLSGTSAATGANQAASEAPPLATDSVPLLHAIAFVGHADECIFFKPLTDIGMQSCQSEMLSSIDAITKKLDGYAPATRTPARAGDVKKEGAQTSNTRFLGEVSQSSKVRVFAYVTATGLKILAATRHIAVSSFAINDLFSALHKAYVKALSNPFAPIGPVRESHASTVGTYLEESATFIRDLESAVYRASASLEFKLDTPTTAAAAAAASGPGGKVSAAYAAYANARE